MTTGESAMRTAAALRANRQSDEHHHDRDRSQALHAVILRLFEEFGLQRILVSSFAADHPCNENLGRGPGRDTEGFG